MRGRNFFYVSVLDWKIMYPTRLFVGGGRDRELQIKMGQLSVFLYGIVVHWNDYDEILAFLAKMILITLVFIPFQKF